MRRLSLPLVLLSAVLAALPVAAQTDETGIVDGLVLDAGGSPVAGAIVRAARPDGSSLRTTVADNQGRFRLGFLPPGGYTVTAQAQGYASQTLESVPVSAGRVVEVEFRLGETGELSETVRVTSQAPLIDTTTTEIGISLSAEQTQIVPSSRDATALVRVTPGARRNQLWGGSTDQANAYQLDGVNVTDPGFGGEFLLPNIDWVEEFQVRGLGAGAEYGNFQGGLVNIVTKSGSNTLEGAVRVNFETAELNSSNLIAGEPGEELDTRLELNASVGGPLVKDRLFYFVSFQEVASDFDVLDSSVTDQVAFLPVQEERTERKALGKLTWQATDNDVFNVVFGIDDVETDNRGLNSIDEPATATTQESPGRFWNLSWQRILGSSQFLEVKYTGFTGDDDRLPLNGARPGVQFFGGGDSKAFVNQKYTRLRTRDNQALSVKWDSSWDTGVIEHRLIAGGEYNDGQWMERRVRNSGLTWRPEAQPEDTFDPEDPATWNFISSDWGGTIDLDADVVNAALYVQDYITVSPRVTVGAGLRLGMWDGSLNFRDGTTLDAMDDTALDPRLGVTWDVAGTGTWVAKASWGRFHQNMFALFFDRACDLRPDGVGGTTCYNDVFEDEEFWDWVGDGATPLPDLTRAYTEQERDDLFVFFDSDETGGEVGPVSDDYSQPYVDEWVLSLERALGERWKVGLAWINREWQDIVALEDVDFDTNFDIVEDVSVYEFPFDGDPATDRPVLDQNGDPLVLPMMYLPTPAYDPDDRTFVLTNVPEATREMDQLQLTVARQGADFWLNGSVVWTDLEGNFFSVSGYDDPDGVGAGPFVDPNERFNFFGDLPNAAEWEVKLSAGVELPWRLTLGAFLLWESGDFYTPVYDIDARNHDFVVNGSFVDFGLTSEVSGERVFLERRGSRELDEFSTVDLHLERPFAIGKDLEFRVAVDVFNLFDGDAVTALRTDVNGQIVDPTDPDADELAELPTTELFGSVRGRQSPRTWRITTVFSW